MPRITRRPLIIAHRGASAQAPENTLAAFRMAIDDGADGVELDVRLSKDGVPVVVHDRGLKRLAGSSALVSMSTAAELASVDLGAYFNKTHPKYARPEFVHTGVPLLADILDFFAAGDGMIHIELKIDKKREVRPIVNAVCRVIHSSSVLSRVVLSSFRLTALAEAKHVLPSVRTSALFAPSIMRFIKRRRHIISLARSFGANEISPYRSLVTPKFARIAHEIGMPVNIWTCNNAKWVVRGRELGVNAVITNYPVSFLAAREALSRAIE